jgi:poly(A) polymerase
MVKLPAEQGQSDEPAPPAVVVKHGHPISKADIDPDALKIIYRLHRLGFVAYITGGAVRDLLLGRPAKDFDIVTEARPGQVKKRFANAYVIGRRFRLVHIHFRGGKTIEVATFRRSPDQAGREAQEGEHVPPFPYGTPEEDAFRRDITINALFYDVVTGRVIDYVGGLEDLARRTIRVIGDPVERFREDPVRMWRVLRHAARLGFSVEPAAEEAISSQAYLLADCPGARLYEELNRDLGNQARPVIEALRRHGLLRHILGKAGADYEADANLFSDLAALLEAEDRARAAGLELSLQEMYAGLFWPWLQPLMARAKIDYHRALGEAFRTSAMRVNIPRMLRAEIIEILIIVRFMIRAMSTGHMRWSLKRRSRYERAARLFFLISRGRLPERGESFEGIYLQAHPAAREKSWRRRRPSRRRQRRAL